MTETTEPPWRLLPDGVSVRVRLTPKAGKDAIEGITDTAEGPAIKARVRAIPEDGAANAALEALVAGWLRRPKRDVAVTAGHKSRIKTLMLAGAPGEISALLQDRLSQLER